MTAGEIPERELLDWRRSMQRVLDDGSGPLRRVTVFRETDSTQDAARRLKAGAGDVIVAGRQTAGRGRMSRRWADTANQGVAITVVLPRASQETAGTLAIAAAVAAAQTAERILGRGVGIKWPNDVVVEGRKLAGVLIEQADERALVGVGMNVLQEGWPDDLAARAVSLKQLGATVSRIKVLCELLERMNQAFEMAERELCKQFLSRDVLVGTNASFLARQQLVHGTVVEVNPLRGLRVQTSNGETWLPAESTTLSVQ